MRIVKKTCKVRIVFFITCLFLAGAIEAQTIHGRVLDNDSHETIPGVVARLTGTSFFGISDSTGFYRISNISPGTYTITFSCLGYLNSSPKRVIVAAESNITLNNSLEPTAIQLNEVTVIGMQNKESEISARDFEKTAPNLINVISGSTIESLPDLNVADVMQRVSGVSMLKNSSGSNTQMVIRGMPPRYNSTLVNGIAMPSTGSSGRSVSLDVFGSELIGRIEVIKALTPDREGNGIGGTVNLIMKEAPDSSFFNAQISIGYNQYNFNNRFLTYDTKSVMPKDFNEQYGSSYVPEISDFPRQNLIINDKQAPPDLHGSVSFGHAFLRNRLRIMVAGGVQEISLASTYNYIDYSNDPYNNLLINYWETQTYCKRQKRYTAYAKLDYHFDDNNHISLYSSLFQLDETRAREVIDTLNEDNRTVSGTGTVHSYSQTITDNSGLGSLVLSGSHRILQRFDLDWSLAYAAADSKSPDYASVFLTQTVSTPTSNSPHYLNYTNAFTRLWQWDKDEDQSAYVNVLYNPVLFNHLFQFKVGGMGRMKFRKNYANEYVFNASDQNANYPNPDILTVPVSTRNDQQLQGNAINNPGNYRAWEDVQAVYGMLTTNFGRLQVLAGMRIEFTYMKNEHNQANPQLPLAHARFSYNDPLPSVHFNYRINPNRNLRLSWYEAINRPNYTEVIPYSDIRPGGGVGNSKLSHSTASCYDLRYEWYPDRKEVFTAGVFYKKITNAIEELVKPGSEYRSIQNVPLCINYGIELVGTKYFGQFGINANYTYTHSSIDVPKHFNLISSDGTVTTTSRMETRPLVGQSPHLINVGLHYRDAEKILKVAVAYTMQGYHVINVNDAYGKDEYQKNYHNLGATFEKGFTGNLTFTLKISNLLNYPVGSYTKDGHFVEKLNVTRVI